MHALEKEMATHSSVLAWRIPGTGEPGGAAVPGVAQSRTRLKRLSSSSREMLKNFSGNPVVKNPPANAGDTGLIPGPGTKIPMQGVTKPVYHNY